MASETTNRAEGQRLPTPADRPSSDVVIYDGDCQFCSKQVRRLRKWDWRGQLSFLSLHDPEVKTRWPDVTREQLMEEIYVMTSEGRRFRGADGFRYLTLRLPPLWVLSPILNFPCTLPIWSWCYRKIARYRYLFNKKDKGDCVGSCDIHFQKKQ